MEAPKKQISDESLLALLRSEKYLEQGFRLLMDNYQERLYWHIRRIVSSHEDTDDVLQNTFIKVYRSVSQFEEKSSLFTWLYRIATNEALSHLSKTKKKSTLPFDNEDYNLKNTLYADEYTDSDKVIAILQEAVKRLPQKQKLVFNMRYYDEMSYADISAVLGTSEGGLKASFHHAVKKIEQYIKVEAKL